MKTYNITHYNIMEHYIFATPGPRLTCSTTPSETAISPALMMIIITIIIIIIIS